MRDLTMAVVAALALTACGGGDKAPDAAPGTTTTSAGGSPSTAAPAAAAGDACALLTDAEVAAALGGAAKAEASTSGEPLNSRLCTWATDTTPPRTFTITVNTTATLGEALRKNGMTARSMFDSAKTAYASQNPEPLAGVGDEAVVVGSTVIAVKGDVYVQTTTAFGDSAAAKAALTDLTAKAVAKL
ncbi:MAG TPA: DUF3558 family protein [Mycobacteriales bacterium]|jgi:hypothetical protein